MKQQANLIRAGQVIEHEGRRWTVLKQQIITPGKGGAFIQVEMRDLKSGNKTNERWRTADTVERLTDRGKGIHLLLQRRHQPRADGPGNLRGSPRSRRPDGRCGAVPAGPDEAGRRPGRRRTRCDPSALHRHLEVVEADPVVKGQTASSSYKPAKLSNGVKTNVPPFIEAGERIVVRTEDASYVERAKG